jgi:hypothetical protein
MAAAGWVGGLADRRRLTALTVAGSVLTVALMFEIVASLIAVSELRGIQPTIPDESQFELWSWQYRGLTSALPPLLLFVALAVGGIVLGSTSVGMAAVHKAKSRMGVRWSFPEEKARLRAELRAVGHAGLVKTGMTARLIVGGVASAGVVLLSWLALSGDAVTSATNDGVERGFNPGYGPKICLAAGLIAIVCVLVAAPWQRWPQARVGPDGSLWVDGARVEPPSGLAVPAVAAVPMAAAAPPPDWYPDPVKRHQLRYWDGQGWTSHVGDAGAMGEDPLTG